MEKQEVTAEGLMDIPVPHDVRISPDGTKVVYSVRTTTRSGEHATSSLWLADVGKEHSARQITSGLFNDQLPQWSPRPSDMGEVAFISDRAKPGESSAIYIVSPSGGGEPYFVTKTENKKQIAGFKWSPNQQFIAFLSPDEKGKDQEAREKATGEAKVYGEDWEYNRIRCVHLATREVVTLLEESFHVTDFAWKGDSSEIACITQETPEVDSAGFHGTTFRKVSVAQGKHMLLSKEKFPGPARNL